MMDTQKIERNTRITYENIVNNCYLTNKIRINENNSR